MRLFRPRRGYPSPIVLLFVGLMIFLGWAAIFEIDQTVRARGQVIPSSRTQIIQAADGGVLSEILVREGESVVAGQRLAILENERPLADYGESRAKVAALKAASIRAKAEIEGVDPVFGPEFDDYPAFAHTQTELHRQRKRELEAERDTLRQTLKIAREALRINKTLFASGDTSRLEVMRARREVSDLQGKLKLARNKYLREASQDLVRVEEALSSTRYKLDARGSVLAHTELSAPVAGIVKYLRVNTIGGVLRAGDELMQISPTDDEMVIEAKINPTDIGQLKLELPATVSLDAFDYAIYGVLSGTLDYLSSDTLTERGSNAQMQTYYRARVALDHDAFRQNPKLAGISLKPGMTATVNIRTDTRTVLEYLAKPILRTFSGAMAER